MIKSRFRIGALMCILTLMAATPAKSADEPLKLTDGQIVKLIQKLSHYEIEAWKHIKENSVSREMGEFATRLGLEYVAVQNEMKNLQESTDIKSEDSEFTQAFSKAALELGDMLLKAPLCEKDAYGYVIVRSTYAVVGLQLDAIVKGIHHEKLARAVAALSTMIKKDFEISDSKDWQDRIMKELHQDPRCKGILARNGESAF